MEGRTVFVKTFGCQMNVYDSNRMEGVLKSQGFKVVDALADADVILINTCSVRDKSEQKVLSLLGQLRPLKATRPDRVIGIAGCVGQRMGRTLLQKVPHLDLVMGPDTVDKVGEFVTDVMTKGQRFVHTHFDGETRSYSQPLLAPEKSKVVEFLTIMKGCDHFCTYCIVPFVRGREKSRTIAEIIEDVKKLANSGTREVTFLGQNINTYGKGTGEKLSALIEAANEVEGLERIRYVTSHPRDMGADLIQQFKTVAKLCPQLHLPFQSGSDSVLKRMSRLYTRKDYLGKIEALRKARPDISLSTDVIVGFPGETEVDFEETLNVMKEVGFSQAYLFKYSPRPGTRAFDQADDVPEAVKEDRLKRIQDIAYAYIEKENVAMIGSKVRVLVESRDKKGFYFSGRTLQNKVCHVLNAGEACVGKELEVEVSEANGSNLKGYYVGAPKKDRRRLSFSL